MRAASRTESATRPRPPRALLRTVAGRVLRRLRRAQGRTLADVAQAARISMPYLSELERGRKEASSEVLAAICAALGIDLADLLAAILQELAEPSVPAIQLRVSVRREPSRAPEAHCLALAA